MTRKREREKAEGGDFLHLAKTDGKLMGVLGTRTLQVQL